MSLPWFSGHHNLSYILDSEYGRSEEVWFYFTHFFFIVCCWQKSTSNTYFVFSGVCQTLGCSASQHWTSLPCSRHMQVRKTFILTLIWLHDENPIFLKNLACVCWSFSEVIGVSPSEGSVFGGTLLNIQGRYFDETDRPAMVLVGGISIKWIIIILN